MDLCTDIEAIRNNIEPSLLWYACRLDRPLIRLGKQRTADCFAQYGFAVIGQTEDSKRLAAAALGIAQLQSVDHELIAGRVVQTGIESYAVTAKQRHAFQKQWTAVVKHAVAVAGAANEPCQLILQTKVLA